MKELLIRRGVVESYLRMVRRNESQIAMLRLQMELPEDGVLLKGIALLHEQSDFSPLFLCGDGSVLLFLYQVHLHTAVRLAKNLRKLLAVECDIKVVCGALTMLAPEDTYLSLEKRLDTFMQRAQEAGDGRICYGTSYYDFCARGGEEEIMQFFFSEHTEVEIYNFYNGMPLQERVKVLSFEEGILRIQTSLAKAAYLEKERFTYIRHPHLPDVVRADVMGARPNRAEVSLTRLHFIDTSPLDRENIRIKPEEHIPVYVDCLEGGKFEGKLEAIAVNSLAVVPINGQPDQRCQAEGSRAELVFSLPEREELSQLTLMGELRYNKDGILVYSLYPNHFAKIKIESYIALQQSKLITILQKMVLNFYQG